LNLANITIVYLPGLLTLASFVPLQAQFIFAFLGIKELPVSFSLTTGAL
jgi:hypothetical protein